MEKALNKPELENADLTKLTKLTRFARALEDLRVTPRSPQPEPVQAQNSVLADLRQALAAQRGNGDAGDSEPD